MSPVLPLPRVGARGHAGHAPDRGKTGPFKTRRISSEPITIRFRQETRSTEGARGPDPYLERHRVTPSGTARPQNGSALLPQGSDYELPLRSHSYNRLARHSGSGGPMAIAELERRTPVAIKPPRSIFSRGRPTFGTTRMISGGRMELTIDRKSFIEIIAKDRETSAGPMLPPPGRVCGACARNSEGPARPWGPGYGPDFFQGQPRPRGAASSCKMMAKKAWLGTRTKRLPVRAQRRTLRPIPRNRP